MLIEKCTSPRSGLTVAQAQWLPALLCGHVDMEQQKGTELCWTDTSGAQRLQHGPAGFTLSYFTLLLSSKMQSNFLLLISFQFGSATQTSIPV